ncbi:MAG: hypothetical protein ABIA76_00440 [Candidatus Diapherotrites archaeon]
MRKTLMNWKVLLALFFVLISLGSILFNGLAFGIDFRGGTLFTIELAEEVTDSQQLSTIRTIIEKRMDAFGLKDTSVSTAGNKYILAQIAETNPDKIAEMEALIKTQGKFEATIEGEVLFNGSDIIHLTKDPRKGYGFIEEDDIVQWRLPFTLKQEAARNFSKLTFHKCFLSSFDPTAGNQYDCDKTYFFIDRPQKTVLVLTEDVYYNDSQLLLQGNITEDIPAGTEISNLLINAKTPYLVVGDELTEEQLTELSSLKAENNKVFVHSSVSTEVKSQLTELGFEVIELDIVESNGIVVPWVWNVTGAHSVIALSPSITNQEPFVENVELAEIFTDLFITGSGNSFEESKTDLGKLTILLETGSLPIGIKSISKETISPSLGSEFLMYSIIIGLIALIVVSLVIFLRYGKIQLTLPIIFTGISEVIITLGIASFFQWNLDLAAVAGILAAVGTGVDDQIVITDEMIRKEDDDLSSGIQKLKKAFFIVIAAAATTIATMSPIIFFDLGLGKIKGFAVTTIVGVLIGVIITRPAYGEIVKRIIEKLEEKN